MDLKVTEHKHTGSMPLYKNLVRVFVDKDYDYGYFVDEHDLFALLSEEQQKIYLAKSYVQFDITPEVAQQIIDMGHTPYTKKKVI